MITYPSIDPVALHLGPLKIHWYGLMYLLGFFVAWRLGIYRAQRHNSHWNSEQVGDLIVYAGLSGIIGGRLGYMLFYSLSHFLANPLTLLGSWEGGSFSIQGMSIHGGFLGTLIGLYLFSRKFNKPFFEVADFIAPLVPLGLGFGRMGNFINGELWGRVTSLPWGMIFPNGGPLPRHPSQLYEALLEGVLLFIILWQFSKKQRPRMAVSALLLICYGSFRIFAECFRQPDLQLGFLAFDWLTMGQLLSVPLVLLGVFLMMKAYGGHK